MGDPTTKYTKVTKLHIQIIEAFRSPAHENPNEIRQKRTCQKSVMSFLCGNLPV